jgi:hypothetical protein
MQSGQFVFQTCNPIKFPCNKIAYEGDSLEGLALFNINMSSHRSEQISRGRGLSLLFSGQTR